MEPTLPSQSAAQINYDTSLTLSVSVTNLEASKHWYGEVLGLEFVYEVPEIGWVEFKTATPGLNLGISAVEKISGQGSLVATFGVVDIESARAHLEQHGVRFEGPNHTMPGMVILATFFDPDGNPFMLSQNLMG